MNKHRQVFAAAILSLTLVSASAQPGMRGGMGGMGPAPSGPNLGSGGMAKIFGQHTGFSATLEMHSAGGADGGEIVVPGKIAYLEGKSRFEMDMTEMKGTSIKPQQAAQMKQMGMGNIINISRPDKKVTWLVYPGLQSYMEQPVADASASADPADYKIEETDQGHETFDGHDCVKKKVVVTNKEGKSHESMVWSATDLKNFPVKIESDEAGKKSSLIFKDVKLEKPDASQFDIQDGLTKYDSMQTMMMQEMMKRAGSMRGRGQ